MTAVEQRLKTSMSDHVGIAYTGGPSLRTGVALVAIPIEADVKRGTLKSSGQFGQAAVGDVVHVVDRFDWSRCRPDRNELDTSLSSGW